MLKVNVRTDRSGHWLEQSILHLVEEAASDRAGSDAMLAKLSEALFVDYLSDPPMAYLTGWRLRLAPEQESCELIRLALVRPSSQTLTTIVPRHSGGSAAIPEEQIVALL